MKGVDNNIYLKAGYISAETILGTYYQDFTPAITHIGNGIFSHFDENGIPFLGSKENPNYAPVLIIQYGIVCHDFILRGEDIDANKQRMNTCLTWLEQNKTSFHDSIVWRSKATKQQYDLPQGWISGMYQGQAISLYLRVHQLLGKEEYLETAKLIFNSFQYGYEEGGFKRIDENGYLWFEEYPTSIPSYVLNGFIYSIFGIYDFYRVTKDEKALALWNECLDTLKTNLHKYDVWYWSVYDQLKEQLVSYYYQKNVHVPLMHIMYQLTGDEVYNYYAMKWEKSLNNPIHRTITKIMYRIQPRLKKLK